MQSIGEIMALEYEISNIYCDESCHLQNDKSSNIMGIAGLVCPKNKYNEIKDEINRIKEKHGISKNTELKWTKISSKKKLAYLELAELFFNKEYLKFRIVLVDKERVQEGTNFNEFYYKICYLLLTRLLEPNALNNIYLDKKDTQGNVRINILHRCLDKIRNEYDANTIKINNVQNIQSHEVAMMQILDILLGATVYHSRKINGVQAKKEIIEFIKKKTGLTLDKTTPLSQHKFNILYFKSDVRNEEM